jgi:uroporphyrinogen decarboxylase
MTHRERALAILRYEHCDRLPIVHFGFWPETLQRWADQGHLSRQEADDWFDGNPADLSITEKLGFDFNWYNTFTPNTFLEPPFEPKLIEETPDGHQKVLNVDGVVVLQKPGTESIPSEIDHTLKTRADWEQHYRHRLIFNESRVQDTMVHVKGELKAFGDGGLSLLQETDRETPLGLHCGSLIGRIRDTIGVVGLSYLTVDDPDLLREIIDTVGELSYRVVENVLEAFDDFDFAHFWEDICYKNGPLVTPALFDEWVGPHYRRITQLLNAHDIDIVSLDCDGKIDALIPTWIDNGVNTMFPIEVGTWEASIAPWREQYGKSLRGVGGMNKVVFSRDRSAIDAEIERLKPLIALGGYIPCPDHRIAPDAEWDNVRYYCDRMRSTFN